MHGHTHSLSLYSLHLSTLSISLIVVLSPGCAPPEQDDHDDFIGQHSSAVWNAAHVLDGGLALPLPLNVTADVEAGSDRDQSDDATILGAADATLADGSCGKWYVSYDNGSDATGRTGALSGNEWKTLNRAFAYLGDPSRRPTCGVIIVEQPASTSSVYDAQNGSDPDQLSTWGDGQSASRHIVVRGELGTGGLRPKIRLGASSSRHLFSITHKNWTIENLDIDFDGNGGRGFFVTSSSSVSSQITENVVIRNNAVHGVRGCQRSDITLLGRKADAVLIKSPATTATPQSSIRRVFVVDNWFFDLFLSQGRYPSSETNPNATASCGTETWNRDDAFGVLIHTNASNVLVKGNRMFDISGDGVQCAGRGKEDPTLERSDDLLDPFNIEITDNRIYVDDDDQHDFPYTRETAVEYEHAAENAVDIKSCNHVTVARNIADGWLGSFNQFKTKVGGSLVSGSERIGGASFINHYRAAQIRTEENTVYDTCAFLGVGRHDVEVEDTVIRQNIFHHSEEFCANGNGAAVSLTKVRNADINNNSLYFPSTTTNTTADVAYFTVGFTVGASDDATIGGVVYESTAHNVDLWNNLVDNAREKWIIFDTFRTTAFRSYKNVYFTRDAATTLLDAKIRQKDAEHPGTCPGVNCYAGSYNLKVFEQRQSGDTIPLFADPAYNSLTPLAPTYMKLPCGSPAAKDAHPIDESRAWTGSAYAITNTPVHYAGAGDPDACMTPSSVSWKTSCSWSDNWRDCNRQAKKRLVRLSFDEFPSTVNTDLEATQWAFNGTWYGKDGRLRGEAADTVAVSVGSDALDSEVLGKVYLTMTGTDYSGIVARATSLTTFYLLRLNRAVGIELVRMQAGTPTVIASHSKTLTTGASYNLRMVVRNTNPVHIDAYDGSTQIVNYDDTSGSRIQSVGGMGYYSGVNSRTQFENFEANEAQTLDAAPSTTLASDNFNACSNNTPPSASLWETYGAPAWYCHTAKLRGESAGGAALVPSIPVLNAEVGSTVLLTSGASNSGVVARLFGGSYYRARLDEANDEVVIERVDGATVTELAAASQTIATSTSYALKLSAYGFDPVELKASLGGTVVATAYDVGPELLQVPGTTGLLSGSANRTEYDDFLLSAK